MKVTELIEQIKNNSREDIAVSYNDAGRAYIIELLEKEPADAEVWMYDMEETDVETELMPLAHSAIVPDDSDDPINAYVLLAGQVLIFTKG